MNTKILSAALIISLGGLSSKAIAADFITPVNLDTLDLGAQIVGPVGPTVDASLIDGEFSLGDLSSGVSCPPGFDVCIPPENPEGTIYTYVHQVTPGVDFDNDDVPFLPQLPVVTFDDVNEFRLEFPAVGFNGVAGFSFGQAEEALGVGGNFSIEVDSDGSIIWTVSGGEGWDTDLINPETISFFWQTTEPPIGPFGTFSSSNGVQSGTGNGPVPAIPVPESSSSLGLLALGIFGSFTTFKFRKKSVINHEK